MTKIIQYKCDCCGYAEVRTYTPGSKFERVMWTVGHMELCDICYEIVKLAISKEKAKDRVTMNEDESN